MTPQDTPTPVCPTCQQTGAAIELPAYNRQGQVRAAKITGVTPQNEDGTTDLLLETAQGQKCRVTVSQQFINQYNPIIGGYYLQSHSNGTGNEANGNLVEMYCPALAFEEGCTLA